MFTLFGYGAAAFAAYLAFAYVAQRSLLFPAPGPPRLSVAERVPDLEQIRLPVSGGEAEAWYLPPGPVASGPAPLLVFAHGNGELIDHWLSDFQTPRSWGLGVLLVEYPGYGRSTGSASETDITRAMVGAYDRLAARPEIDSARILGFGRSLGGGAICALARQRDLAALILESTFTSVARMAGRFGVPRLLVRDPFDNIGLVKRYSSPVLVIHGEHDEIIPVAHGRALQRAAPHAELSLLPCGHNDCARPWERIRRFLSAHGLGGRGAGARR